MERVKIDLDERARSRGWWWGKDGKNPGPIQEKDSQFMEGWNEGLAVRYESLMPKKEKQATTQGLMWGAGNNRGPGAIWS